MRVRLPVLALLGAATLASCERPVTAPNNPGVCWRQIEGLNGKPDFRIVAPNIESLENCAVRLESLRMMSGRPVVGAFQGRFIYVTDSEITAATGPKAQRYRVFTPEQRAKIQEGVRTLMDRERGAAEP
jgi:hypothetical protein